MSEDEVAYGFIKIANETMTRPIRSLTESKGHDVCIFPFLISLKDVIFRAPS